MAVLSFVRFLRTRQFDHLNGTGPCSLYVTDGTLYSEKLNTKILFVIVYLNLLTLMSFT